MVDERYHPVGVGAAVDQVTDLDHHEVVGQDVVDRAEARQLDTQLSEMPSDIADDRDPHRRRIVRRGCGTTACSTALMLVGAGP
ncbi:hypothetical protein GCM10023147_04520 [Tsukamurella soli]|uniref:Uncharacterized protein n=1 Tax=Tsukamurella soli TaxID=644556 RepID=A0ABP8J398_9ACTN